MEDKTQDGKLYRVLKYGIENDVSDVFIIGGLPLTFKLNGMQHREGDSLGVDGVMDYVTELYTLAKRDPGDINLLKDDDFSFALPNVGRFRANVYRQRGSLAAVIRIIHFGLPDPSKLNIPETVLRASDFKNGLVLVTGPAGNGKSTTLACMIDRINKTTCGHIITMEDPIEFIHRHDKCIVSQREIPGDSPTYVKALRSALRESPNTILLGEMRDRETIEVAMTAAETGELLFSTLHTTGAANTIDRIVDVFPPNQQKQIRIQLSMILRAVISQELVPTVDGKLIPAFEIMYTNTAIKNLIREAKTYQIDSAINAGTDEGMITMDNSLYSLYEKGIITKETALTYCQHSDVMNKKLESL